MIWLGFLWIFHVERLHLRLGLGQNLQGCFRTIRWSGPWFGDSRLKCPITRKIYDLYWKTEHQNVHNLVAIIKNPVYQAILEPPKLPHVFLLSAFQISMVAASFEVQIGWYVELLTSTSYSARCSKCRVRSPCPAQHCSHPHRPTLKWDCEKAWR